MTKLQKLKETRKPSRNDEMAEVLDSMELGDVVKIYGDSTTATLLAASLSRTRKKLTNTRLSTHNLKTGGVKITCVSSKEPLTVIVM
jgi:hypothetical protein